MFSSADKVVKSTPAVQQKAAGNTSFFRKAGEENFFGAKESPVFFTAPVQAKLTVSSPDDPQEREADAVADKVMRMPEPIAAALIGDKNEGLQKKDNEKLQTKQPTSIVPAIQCKDDKEDKLQAKLSTSVYWASAEGSGIKIQTCAEANKPVVNRKNITLFHSDIMRQSGRDPPASSIPFEQTLASSKGGGSALPSDTREFMESRFNADFSGVRIHTNSTAETLSSSIQAQAFAHGNDIYFNSGKYSPNSTDGKTLLAHELTHTIQQGASKSNVSPKSDTNLLTEKNIDRSINDNPSFLSAKTEEANDKEDTKGFKKVGNESSEPKTVEQAFVQPKTEFSNSTVDTTGSVHSITDTSIIKTTGKEEIQNKEEHKEEDKYSEVQVLVQKSSVNELSVNAATSEKVSSSYDAPSIVAAKPQHLAFSSINTNHYIAAKTGMIQERGPPIQRMLTTSNNTVIQCSLFDNALSRVGEFLSDIPITVDVDEAKRWLMGGLRRFASYIPGYRALGVVLGRDPITGEEIAQNGRSFIEAALDIIPGGNLLKQKLEELGIVKRAATWIDTQIASVTSLIQNVGSEFLEEWNRLGLTSILDGPTEILRRFGNILERAINNIIDFATRAGRELLDIVKKFLLTHIVSFVKQHTNAYELLKVILEKDPITEEPVQRNGTNILNALLELGGEAGREQRRQMQETGTFQKAADWIDRGIAVFGDLYTTIRGGFSQIWDIVSIDALMHPIDTFNQIYEIFAGPIRRVLTFVEETLSVILGFIKEALMSRLSAWAATIRGYRLVTVIIGKDPFTNATVPRTVENIIRGFMSLMEGGEEQFNQLKESGAIGRAVQRINAAVARLNMTPEYIIQLFIQLWNAFSFADLANPVAAFQRILDRFGEPIGRLIAFVVEIVKIVLEVVMQVMNFPSDLIANIIARAMQAFEMIKQDPVGFLKNLLRSIKQGFVQFFNNILRHLLAGLQGWLMSELRDSGVQAPQDFTLRGIIGWVLQLLGITMDKIWEKLAQHPRIGPQKVARIRGIINQLEGIWTFIKDVQERGMAAIWDKIQERLSSLWDTILDAVKNWIMEQIVNRVTARLLTMLDPTGIMAVVNSAIALYRAVQSFMRYLRQMLEIVNSFVEGVVQIASGNITVAANFLERSMARGVPVMIGFLANQVGLSGLGRRINEMIERVRSLVDQALTWLVNRAVNMGMNLLDRVLTMGRAAADRIVGALRNLLGLNKEFTASDGENHRLYYIEDGSRIKLMVASDPIPINNFLSSASIAIDAMRGSNKSRLLRVHRSASTTHQSMQDNERLLDQEQDRGRQNSIQRTIQTQMNSLANNLAELAPIVGVSYPPAIMPPMLNGVKARNFTAEYISDAVPNGSEAGSYNGRTLPGWGVIVGAGLNLGSQYVKMHLLPHRLGGDAVDSNLTPAAGQAVNLVFSRSVEQQAIAAKAAGETIWYRVTINYHSGTLSNNFPSFIKSEWGVYRRSGNQYTKVEDPARQYSASPPLPAITNAMVINTAPDRMLADFLRIDYLLARLIVRLRGRFGNFTSATDVINKIDTNATTANKNRIGNFDNAVDALTQRLGNYNGRVSYT